MKNVIKKEWIGKRKIRIYLLQGNIYYSFCWLQFLKDGSLSFGFQSKKLQQIREYGSAVSRSGFFTGHAPILRSGNVDIRDVSESHITFHPPKVFQKSGIVHIVANKKEKVDEFELDWFPVNSPQIPLYVYSGDIANLEKTTNLKGRYEIIQLPSSVQCIRMELKLYPIPRKPIRIDDPHALTNIHGFCPKYIVSCRFYKDNAIEAGYYIATDVFER